MSLRKKILMGGLTLILAAGAGTFYFYKKNRGLAVSYEIIKKGTLTQEVSATGKVDTAQNVDLSFEKSGKITRAYAKVGDKVKKGQLLATLSSGDLAAQVLEAKAALDSQKTKLAEMKAGTRTEELAVTQTSLDNAESKAAADLKEDYDAALTALEDAADKGKNAILTVSDFQFKYFITADQDGSDIASKKEAAVLAFLGEANAGRLASEEISKLSGGAYGSVQTAVSDYSPANIDTAISDVSDALEKVKTALGAIPIKTSFTSTEKTNLSTEKTNISSAITSVSAKEQAIAVQKTTNQNNIATAEANLALKQAGYTEYQIAAQEAQVKSAEAGLLSAQAQAAKAVIYSPIAGTISKQDAKAGQMAAASAVLISIISDSNFEIETYIPEADISKIKTGNAAKITLDAYGNDVEFDGTVASIDPGETMIDGVATYKTILQFSKDDARVKSGMTANIDIITETKDGVLYVPARAVSSKSGKKYVKVLKDEKTMVETEVEVGIRGAGGNVEITSGLNEGDKAITAL